MSGILASKGLETLNTIITLSDDDSNRPSGAIQGVSEGFLFESGCEVVDAGKGVLRGASEAIEGKAAGGRRVKALRVTSKLSQVHQQCEEVGNCEDVTSNVVDGVKRGKTGKTGGSGGMVGLDTVLERSGKTVSTAHHVADTAEFADLSGEVCRNKGVAECSQSVSEADRITPAQSVGDVENSAGSSLGNDIGDLHKNAAVAVAGAPSYLVNITELRAALENEHEKQRVERVRTIYWARDIYQAITIFNRRKFCGSALGAVMHKQKDGKSYYAGTALCLNFACCPTCSNLLRVRKGFLLGKIFVTAQSQGYGLAHVVWTMQHDATQSLEENIQLLRDCKLYVQSHRQAKKLRKKLGYASNTLNTEITFLGGAGAHPHMHETEIFKGPLTDDDALELKIVYTKLANDFYVSKGHKPISGAYGIMIEPIDLGAETLAKYVMKLQAGEVFMLRASAEMMLNDFKKGRGNSVAYLELLAMFGETGDMELAEQINATERALKGKSISYINPKTYKLFMPEEKIKTDEELATELVNGVSQLAYEEWFYKDITRMRLRGEVLATYDEGGYSALVDLFERYEMDVRGYRLPTEEEKQEDIITALDVKKQKEVNADISKRKQRRKQLIDMLYSEDKKK